jgi:protease I
MGRLSGRRVAVFVAEGVEDLEYYVPLMRLQEEGAEVLSVGLFGVVVPGGWAPDKLRRSRAVLEIVRAVYEAGKPLGIICHGGLVPISAGIVRGHKATGSLGIKDDLVNAGATWVDEPAFREGNLVWGRVVPDIPAFCRELIAALAEE